MFGFRILYISEKLRNDQIDTLFNYHISPRIQLQ